MKRSRANIITLYLNDAELAELEETREYAGQGLQRPPGKSEILRRALKLYHSHAARQAGRRLGKIERARRQAGLLG